jgi:hypothetical protein
MTYDATHAFHRLNAHNALSRAVKDMTGIVAVEHLSCHVSIPECA